MRFISNNTRLFRVNLRGYQDQFGLKLIVAAKNMEDLISNWEAYFPHIKLIDYDFVTFKEFAVNQQEVCKSGTIFQTRSGM